jgi:hypothetical protein
MRFHGRTIAKWVSAGAAAGLASCWVLSGWFLFRVVGTTSAGGLWFVGVRHGFFGIGYNPLGRFPPGVNFYRESVRPVWDLKLSWEHSTGGTFIACSVWIVALAAGAAAILLWLPDLRARSLAQLRDRAGLCTTCGYNRRGLATKALCPECGTLPAPATV